MLARGGCNGSYADPAHGELKRFHGKEKCAKIDAGAGKRPNEGEE